MKYIEWIKSKWQKSPVASAMITLASGQMIAQVVNLISAPVISRLYSQTAFGNYAAFVSTAIVVCALSQLGLASTIMLADTHDNAKLTFTSIFCFFILC